MKQRYAFIDALKAIAALLIINSHYDTIYPVAALATGGALGNAIFFAVSGFCRYSNAPQSDALRHFGHPASLLKLLGLYIPTWLMTLFAVFTYKNEWTLEFNWLALILWPTPFWFIGAIIVFYILYDMLARIVSAKDYAILISITGVIYFVYYLFLLDTSKWVVETPGLSSAAGLFKLIYYFLIMMIGKWFRIHDITHTHKTSFYLFGVAASIISLYGVKALMTAYPSLMRFQFLNQVSVVCFILFLFPLFRSLEPNLQHIRSVSPLYVRLSDYMGGRTIYFYLVQFFAIFLVRSTPFPANFFIASCLIFIFAEILYRLSKWILGAVALVLTRL